MDFVEMALPRRCTSVHFSIQPICMPARDGQHRVPAQGMQAVGRSVHVVSNFTRYSGAQIHSLGRRAFQAVGRYMPHSCNDLRLSRHSWRRPVTAYTSVILRIG